MMFPHPNWSWKAFSKVITIYLFIVLSLVYTLSFGEHTAKNDTIFVPTHEWQTVHPGQQLPPSLHIRHDLKTGITEAKLMDPEERISENLPAPSSNIDITNESHIPDNHSASGNLGPDSLLLPYIEEEPDEPHLHYIKSKFRSYDELKADFEKINAQVKTDFELLLGIMQALNESDVSEERLPFLLEDLSYLLHQVDNGRLFSEKDGFTLLKRYLFHPNITIQKQVLSAMSAAIQGNSDVKVVALRAGLLDILCLKLRDFTNHTYSPGESVTMMFSTLTTLSVLLRDFPSAQKQFFSTDSTVLAGFDLLGTVFDYSVDGSGSQNKLSRLRTQLHGLVSDLALERTNAKEWASTLLDEKSRRLVNLYSETEFESALARSRWCDRLQYSLLHDMPHGVSIDRLDTVSNHGSRQELLYAILYLYPFCNKMELDVNRLLQGLEQEYAARLAQPENKDDIFFQDLLHLIMKVRKLYDGHKTSRGVADEL